MAADEIKQNIRKMVDIFNQPNWAELIRAQAKNDQDLQDIEGFIQEHQVFRNAFPDYHTTLEEILVEGDRVVTRSKIHATHMAEFPVAELKGIPATGRPLEWTEVNFYTVKGENILESLLIVEGVPRLQQLGVLPQPTE